MQTRSVDQRLTALEQKMEALFQRVGVGMFEHQSRQLANISSTDLILQLPNQRSTQQPQQQPYQQSHQQSHQRMFQHQNRQLANISSTDLTLQLPNQHPTQQPQVNFVYPPRPNNPGASGWQNWSCCMLWFGLSHLLGGIGMLVFGVGYMITALSCKASYTLINGQCCDNTYNYNCYNPTTSSFLTPGIVLLCVGFIVAIVGIVFLCKACKFYDNNNATCC